MRLGAVVHDQISNTSSSQPIAKHIQHLLKESFQYVLLCRL